MCIRDSIFSDLGGVGNDGVPVADLVKVGFGGVLSAVLAAAVASLGAVRARVGTG